MTVERYLQALSDKDETTLLELTCPEHEFDALLEFDALAQVQTVLKDVSCQQVGADGDTALIRCSGSIVSNYGGELFSYDLTGRTYQVIADEDRLLVCGYTR